ncbi:MAG: hypothetical protein JXR95_03110 [Deltaproteobacteria bacterium]|nr:hypothetical protein [Deltaproteobacteria bacterium]
MSDDNFTYTLYPLFQEKSPQKFPGPEMGTTGFVPGIISRKYLGVEKGG